MTSITPPIELTGTAARLGGGVVSVATEVLERLASICDTTTEITATAEASRDWWPLAMHWALAGQVPQRATVVARPAGVDQVAALLSVCNEAHVPVTASGGRSGVCGAAVPLFGGVVLDLTGLDQIGEVDSASGVVEVGAGVFGPDLERTLRAEFALTVGHFPQSFDLATVGGWVACRGAGQYSTRYGKIDAMVVGLEAVLADGRVVRTGGSPAAAVGPDLDQLLLGSEGTLAVITRVWLRAHPLPPAERRAAYSFASLADGFEACRRSVRRGATPAVLRLYDAIESTRGRGGDGTSCTLLVLDEGDPAIVDATMSIVHDACTEHGRPADEQLVADWLEHRNDTSALQALTRKGYVVDTMEIAAPWSRLEAVHAATTEALTAAGAKVASCHLSHSYLDGACLYFTFAATCDRQHVETTYVALWDAGQRAVLRAGGNLSHHHGVGLNRARFMREALGPAFDMLVAVKRALDPNGILNPGKLGLPHRFGDLAWP